MKTHINQVLTVVSFFSLSVTTILAISWGMNGLIVKDQNLIAQCIEQNKEVIQVIHQSSCNNYNDSSKLQNIKKTLKLNGQ